MLLKTISFDDTCDKWTKDKDYNITVLRYLESNFNDLIKCRGYVYLNQICEQLCGRWNPDDANICIRRGNYLKFKLDELTHNVFIIDINMYPD